jgi:[acyl-carrier-protein] S-malonyltransferase
MAKVAWLFPGQGTQEVGMGKAAFDASAAARAVFERSVRVLAATGGISKLCFEGPKDELTLTANTQPAVVTTSLAVLAALREAIPELPAPSFAAGHSLGEYSALVAAGAFELEDAVRIVRLRGQAMQEAVLPGEGAMAAIMGLAPEVVEAVCAEAAAAGVVSPANFNSPGQIVIAGHVAAVKRASELASARGGKPVMLPVSAPFHCSLMRPAAERIAPELAAVALRPLAFPVVANVDGEPNQDPGRVRDLLVRQIDGSVQWVKSVERMAAEGVTHALEIGPGKILAGFAKRITKDLRVLSVSDPASAGEVRTFLGL